MVSQRMGTMLCLWCKRFLANIYQLCGYQKNLRGSFMITEGQKISHVYLVKEGECKIISSKMPIIHKNEKSKFGQLFQRDLLQNKSYFSKTTSQFQLGIISQKEWIGNEDIQYYFEDTCTNKCKWLEKRFYDIAKNLNKLKDEYFETLSEQSHEVVRQYPQARAHALHTFRNRQIAKIDLSKIELNSQLNGANSNYQQSQSTITSANVTPQPVHHVRGKSSADFTKTDMFALSTIVGGDFRAGKKIFNFKKDSIQNLGTLNDNYYGQQDQNKLESQRNTTMRQSQDNIRVVDINQSDASFVGNGPSQNLRMSQSQGNFFDKRNTKQTINSDAIFGNKRGSSQIFPQNQTPNQQQRQHSLSKNLSIVKANHLVQQLVLPHFKQQETTILNTIQTETDTQSVNNSWIKSPKNFQTQNTQNLFTTPKQQNIFNSQLSISQSSALLNAHDISRIPKLQQNRDQIWNTHIKNKYSQISPALNSFKQQKQSSQSNLHNKHMLLFCSSPSYNRDQLMSQGSYNSPHNQMSTASMYSPNKNQLIPRISQKFEIIRQKVKPQSIFNQKESARLQTSQEKMKRFVDQVQEKNETFFVGDKKIQLLTSSRQQNRKKETVQSQNLLINHAKNKVSRGFYESMNEKIVTQDSVGELEISSQLQKQHVEMQGLFKSQTLNKLQTFSKDSNSDLKSKLKIVPIQFDENEELL
eukprot:403348008